MPEEYLREQLWKLYENLPEELKEAVFSAETAENIDNICKRNGVEEGKVPEIAKATGRALMGLLPPDEFEKALTKEVGLKTAIAKSVAREINRFIFSPVKEVLSKLYEIEIAPPAKSTEAIPSIEKPAEAPLKPPLKEKPEKPDTYREPIGSE